MGKIIEVALFSRLVWYLGSSNVRILIEVKLFLNAYRFAILGDDADFYICSYNRGKSLPLLIAYTF